MLKNNVGCWFQACLFFIGLEILTARFSIDHQIQFLVDEHNKYRSAVNPSAADMRQMSWDPELAKIAAIHAEECEFKHNLSYTTSLFDTVGENLYAGVRKNVDDTVTDSVRAWYNDEVGFYDYPSRTCSLGIGKCGHYTQVVWATTYKFGCAMSFCRMVQHLGFRALLLSCYYGPMGNLNKINGNVSTPLAPYTQGISCSKCGEMKCVGGKLCAPKSASELLETPDDSNTQTQITSSAASNPLLTEATRANTATPSTIPAATTDLENRAEELTSSKYKTTSSARITTLVATESTSAKRRISNTKLQATKTTANMLTTQSKNPNQMSTEETIEPATNSRRPAVTQTTAETVVITDTTDTTDTTAGSTAAAATEKNATTSKQMLTATPTITSTKETKETTTHQFTMKTNKTKLTTTTTTTATTIIKSTTTTAKVNTTELKAATLPTKAKTPVTTTTTKTQTSTLGPKPKAEVNTYPARIKATTKQSTETTDLIIPLHCSVDFKKQMAYYKRWKRSIGKWDRIRNKLGSKKCSSVPDV